MGRFQSRAAWVLVVLAWRVDKIWTASLLFVFKELLIFTSVCSPWRRSRSLPCQRYRTHSWKDQVQPKNHLRCAIFDLRWVEKSPWVATWVVAGVRMAGLANLNQFQIYSIHYLFSSSFIDCNFYCDLHARSRPGAAIYQKRLVLVPRHPECFLGFAW